MDSSEWCRLDNDLGPIFMLPEVDDSVVMDASVAKVIMGLVAEGIVEETVDRACLYASCAKEKRWVNVAISR